MNLYLIVRPDEGGYDEYDSAVVCADSEVDARSTHPSGSPWNGYGREEGSCYDWIDKDLVEVTLLGRAELSIPKGVVCASFNAG